jgi:tartrate dehydratase alpha subunit/fumarate hydratase class I-like protein
MKAKTVCPLCKDTGIVLFTIEYPNLIDSRWCHQCEVGARLALLVDSIIARTLRKVRAA